MITAEHQLATTNAAILSTRFLGRLPFFGPLAFCLCVGFIVMSRSSAHTGAVDHGGVRTGQALLAEGTRRIPLQAKELIVDPNTHTIYASVPGNVSPGGNSITSIDPFAGTVGASVFVGSEPRRLAISDDRQFIYVGLDGEAAIRRFDIATQTAQLRIPLGSTPSTGPYIAEDIEVLPGSPQSIAVSRNRTASSPPHDGVVVFDDDVQRPTVTNRSQTINNAIEFSASAGTLYGFDNEDTSLQFAKLSVTASGVSLVSKLPGLLNEFGNIKFDGGLIYHTAGRVVDPEAHTIVGTYSGMNFGFFNSAKSVVVDSPNNRVYFLTGGAVDPGSNGFTRVYAFNKTTFALVASLDIFVTTGYTTGPVSNLVQYSPTGLAFRDDNTLYLIDAPGSTPPASPTPTPSPTPTATPTPTPGPGELRQISLASRDLIVEPNSQTLYASTGDQLTRIDPVSGSIGTSITVGAQTDKLAVADNGQYIYVGLDGENAISRFDVGTQSSNLKFPVASGAVDIEVLPGNPNAVAVVRHDSFPKVVVYDGGNPRPLTQASGVTRLAFSNSPEVLYGYDTDSSAFEFTKMVVESCGVGQASSVNGLITGNVYDIRYDNGRLYSAGGRVIDPETGSLVGTFFVPHQAMPLCKQNQKPAAFIRSLATDPRQFYACSTCKPSRWLAP